MKALSLRQPWAYAVLHGKNIENRRWNTSFRGEFLIHASAGMTADEHEEAWHFCRLRGLAVPPRALLERGGIVGRARLVDVVRPCVEHPTQVIVGSGAGDGGPCDRPWHMHEQFGFVLEDATPLPFVPMKGSLGFFGVPESALGEEPAR